MLLICLNIQIFNVIQFFYYLLLATFYEQKNLQLKSLVVTRMWSFKIFGTTSNSKPLKTSTTSLQLTPHDSNEPFDHNRQPSTSVSLNNWNEKQHKHYSIISPNTLQLLNESSLIQESIEESSNTPDSGFRYSICSTSSMVKDAMVCVAKRRLIRGRTVFRSKQRYNYYHS